MLRVALSAADEDRINVFSVMFHPWDFEKDEDFKVWQEWLTTIIAPIAKDGRVIFSTLGEVAELYEKWEERNVPK